MLLTFLSTTNVAAVTSPITVILGSRLTALPLTRENLRDIYFLRETHWPNGLPIKVFVLPDSNPIHVRFAKEVLGVFPYQLSSVWRRLVYSGIAVPPILVDTIEEMRHRVAITPGAIGYTN